MSEDSTSLVHLSVVESEPVRAVAYFQFSDVFACACLASALTPSFAHIRLLEEMSNENYSLWALGLDKARYLNEEELRGQGSFVTSTNSVE